MWERCELVKGKTINKHFPYTFAYMFGYNHFVMLDEVGCVKKDTQTASKKKTLDNNTHT